MKKSEESSSLFFCNGYKTKKVVISDNLFCDPVGIRTQDPIIKSDVLYQLSYRIIAKAFLLKRCKDRIIFKKNKRFISFFQKICEILFCLLKSHLIINEING